MEEQHTIKITDSFMDIEVGDTVTRLFYGTEMNLEVTEITERLIHTKGGWMFDRSTGIEEDPELGIGVEFNVTCSNLIKKTT